MGKKSLENKGERNKYTPLSTEYNYVHSRTLEEFPEGPYGSATNTMLGKTSGWDTGEEVNPRFSYENEQLHEASERHDEFADPIREHPKGHLE
ncbi:hypothetical protein [Caldalkalibacillus salinus]|uniref:hypothetical protein n=1 Tax=Caldalkalibacillus salinus TaxID=2803787 RepID=UPI00192450FF|nr:hypothetical protein [Caldalkalibacillus salinus]